MNHPGQARLQRYVLGELNTEGMLAFDEHLAVCAQCREQVVIERRLDGLILGAVPPADAQATERAFARLWDALDDVEVEVEAAPCESNDATPDAGRLPGLSEAPSPRPSTSPATPNVPGVDVAPSSPAPLLAWLPLLAAAVLIMLLQSSPDDASDAPAADPDAVSPIADSSTGDVIGELPGELMPGASSAVEAVAGGADESFDAERHATARSSVASVLLSAADQFPFARDAFRLACDTGLAELRRDGWPVDTLARGLALGEDDAIAAAALRYAALQPATYPVLARALEAQHRRADALAVLADADHGVDVDASSALVRALERLAAGLAAEGDDRRLAEAAHGLLAAAAGPRVERARARLSDGFRTQLRRARRPAELDALLSDLRGHVPVAVLLEGLLEASSRSSLEPICTRHFQELAALDPGAAVQLVDDGLRRADTTSTVLDWCLVAGLEPAASILLEHLEDGGSPDDLLPALEQLGDEHTALGLYELWHEADSRRAQSSYVRSLERLLLREPALVTALGERVAVDRAESLAELAEQLDPAARSGLLVSALAITARGADHTGRQAALITQIGRLGSAQDGEALLEWIAARPDSDPLLPLAWAAAGRLAEGPAQRAWSERGLDPRQLAGVVGDVRSRFTAAVEPSARLLAPLRRSLGRLADLSPQNLPEDVR